MIDCSGWVTNNDEFDCQGEEGQQICTRRLPCQGREYPREHLLCTYPPTWKINSSLTETYLGAEIVPNYFPVCIREFLSKILFHNFSDIFVFFFHGLQLSNLIYLIDRNPQFISVVKC